MPRSMHRWSAAGAVLLFALIGSAALVRADAYQDIEARLNGGQLREAADAAQALTAANPADCRAWLLLGDSRRRLSQMDKAVQAYREGLKACPDDKPLLKALGMLFDEAEQYDEAVKSLDHLWTLDSSDPEVGSRLGAAAYRAGRCTEGRHAFETLLKAHPERMNDHLAYAQLLARSCKDYAAAETEYKTILAQRPNDPSIACALSYMFTAAGRFDEAVQVAQKGLATAPGDAGCLYAAWGRALETDGDSLMVKGQVDQARDFYRQAMAPLTKGSADPLFGDYCKAILAEVKYKEAPMERLAP